MANILSPYRNIFAILSMIMSYSYLNVFFSGWENGLRNVMMTVKHQIGLQQIQRYWISILLICLVYDGIILNRWQQRNVSYAIAEHTEKDFNVNFFFTLN